MGNGMITGQSSGNASTLQQVPYIGNGASSKEITFSFAPKLVFVGYAEASSVNLVIAVNPCVMAVAFTKGGQVPSGVNLAWNGNTVTLSGPDSGTAMNYSGLAYTATAIG